MSWQSWLLFAVFVVLAIINACWSEREKQEKTHNDFLQRAKKSPHEKER